MRDWNGIAMQHALLKAEIVEEDHVTDAGPGKLYYLKLDSKIVPLGTDRTFASLLGFALVRNARAFERAGKET